MLVKILLGALSVFVIFMVYVIVGAETERKRIEKQTAPVGETPEDLVNSTLRKFGYAVGYSELDFYNVFFSSKYEFVILTDKYLGFFTDIVTKKGEKKKQQQRVRNDRIAKITAENYRLAQNEQAPCSIAVYRDNEDAPVLYFTLPREEVEALLHAWEQYQIWRMNLWTDQKKGNYRPTPGMVNKIWRFHPLDEKLKREEDVPYHPMYRYLYGQPPSVSANNNYDGGSNYNDGSASAAYENHIDYSNFGNTYQPDNSYSAADAAADAWAHHDGFNSAQDARDEGFW